MGQAITILTLCWRPGIASVDAIHPRGRFNMKVPSYIYGYSYFERMTLSSPSSLYNRGHIWKDGLHIETGLRFSGLSEAIKSTQGHQHNDPDSKVHGANMGPTWVLSAPDGPHVGPMNLAIRGATETIVTALANGASRSQLNSHGNTVKPVYNDHLMGHFAATWSSSRWPLAT